MIRNITETPEKWVIVKLPNNVYKVFGTWAGGYLSSDRWQLNSGINKVEQDDKYYYFIGFSGSCYQCHKKSYGIATSFGDRVLENLKTHANGRLEALEDVQDWEELLKK